MSAQKPFSTGLVDRDFAANVMTDLHQTIAKQAQEIARLTERCDAYLGQVKAGDEQILALRDRAKEMQREKVELRQRCDAYKEIVDAAQEVYDWLKRNHMDTTAHGQLLGAALAALQDKTP